MYKNEKWQHYRWKQRPVKTNTQTHIKIYHNSQTEQKTQIVQIHRQRNGARTAAAPPYAASSFASGVVAFAFRRHVNLNKERNKRARRLGVDARGARGRRARCLEVVWSPASNRRVSLQVKASVYMWSTRRAGAPPQNKKQNKHLHLLFGGFKAAVGDVESGRRGGVEGCLPRVFFSSLLVCFTFPPFSSFVVFNMRFQIKERE